MAKSGFGLFLFYLKNIVKDIKKMALIFVVPFLMMMIIGLSFVDTEQIDSPFHKIELAIVDQEQSLISQMLIENIAQEESLSNLLDISIHSIEKAEIALKNGEITAYIVIPANFSTGLLNMENPAIELFYNGQQTIEFYIIERTMASFSFYVRDAQINIASQYYALLDMDFTREEALRINEAISFRLIMDTLGRKMIFEMNPIFGFPSVSSATYHGVSLLVLVMFFLTTLAGYERIEESNSKILQRVLISDVPLFLLYLTKVIAFTFVIGLWMVIVMVFISDKISNDYSVKMMVTIIAYVFFLLSLFMSVSCFVRSKYNYLSVVSVSIVMMAFAGGAFFPIVLMPYWMSVLAQWTPNLMIARNLMMLIYAPTQLSYQWLLLASLFIIGTFLIGLSSLFIKEEGLG